MANKNFNSTTHNLDQTIINTFYPKDEVNKWKNEVWTVKGGNGSILYHKDKTWQNCWKKYGLLSLTDGNNEYSSKNPYRPNYSNTNFRFPSIVNLQDYIEQGGTVSWIWERLVDRNWLAEELYRITPNIDWSRCNYYYGLHRDRNFIGSQWYTHAWDNKGVKLGRIGWGRPWIFNFSKAKTFKEHENDYHSVTLPFAFAGGDILDIHFRFEPNVVVENIQGILKATQTESKWAIEDMQGNPLVSTANTGMSPYVISEAFKQAGDKINRTPQIYYGNVTDCSQIMHTTWSLTHLSSFNGVELGSNAKGNVLTLNKPKEHTGTYPNYGRNCSEAFAHAYALTHIGPLIECKYNRNSDLFVGSSNITEVRLRNWNGTNCELGHCSKLSEASVKYLLENAYDRRGNYRDYSNDERILNSTFVKLPIELDIKLHANTADFVTQEHKDSLKRKGWRLFIGNEHVNP